MKNLFLSSLVICLFSIICYADFQSVGLTKSQTDGYYPSQTLVANTTNQIAIDTGTLRLDLTAVKNSTSPFNEIFMPLNIPEQSNSSTATSWATGTEKYMNVLLPTTTDKINSVILFGVIGSSSALSPNNAELHFRLRVSSFTGNTSGGDFYYPNLLDATSTFKGISPTAGTSERSLSNPTTNYIFAKLNCNITSIFTEQVKFLGFVLRYQNNPGGTGASDYEMGQIYLKIKYLKD